MTVERGTARVFAIFAATVAWCGVLLQLDLSLKQSLANGKTFVEGLLIYSGYFTILTNILVGVVLTLPLVAPTYLPGRFLSRPGVRTATAAAITGVGVVYFFLLRQVWNPQGWQLVADVVLHYVTPVLFLAYWWIGVPKAGLRRSQVAAWASYPIGYFVYVLVRGELTGLYPYHFLDVGSLGYGRTLMNGLGVLVAFVLLSLLLLLAGRWQSPLTAGSDTAQQQHPADGASRRH